MVDDPLRSGRDESSALAPSESRENEYTLISLLPGEGTAGSHVNLLADVEKRTSQTWLATLGEEIFHTIF